MEDFRYTPDKEQRVHARGAISLICRAFQSHESGLPEWVKNAADAYVREEAKPERRIVVLLLCDKKSLGKPSMACLDFVGTTADKIERYFRHWADPNAAIQETQLKVQGGHGNGGKCYMTQMFTDHALFHTVRDGEGCCYGVKGGSVNFGYVPNAEEGRRYSVPDAEMELDRLLRELGTTFDGLPPGAQRAFELGSGFTLVRGVGPRHYEQRIRVNDLIGQLRDHPQMLTTLDYCEVFVLYDGRRVRGCTPLQPSPVTPISGAEEPRIVEIPEALEDPVDGTELSTIDNGTLPSGRLTLLTSDKSMRWKKKSRHTINYYARDGFIGYKGIREFGVQSAYQDQIYGTCELEALDPFKQNHRGPLAETPLTRAVERFIERQIEEYAQEFERRDRKAYSKKERNALSRMNEALDRWKNRFIKDFVEGAFGQGGGGGSTRHGGSLPGGKPSTIEIAITHPRLGLGVAIRPRIRFFDSRSRQIRPVPYRWVSEDPNVAMVLEELMVINSFAPGQTTIYAETEDGAIQSNRVPLQTVRIRSIRIEPEEVELVAGSRTQLRAVCHMSSGEEVDDIALVWTEGNASIARVSSSGMLFGASPGKTEIAAGDDRVSADRPAIITVVEGDGDDEGPKKGSGKGSGSNRGRGYPLILVSGVDRDPDTDQPVTLSPDYPPTYQRPIDADRNIWWINSSAPLAKMYLDQTLDYGFETREWRMYHLERYIDIITQIAMTYDPQNAGVAITVNEYFLRSADKVSEIQRAIAEELSGFIKDGAAIPEG